MRFLGILAFLAALCQLAPVRTSPDRLPPLVLLPEIRVLEPHDPRPEQVPRYLIDRSCMIAYCRDGCVRNGSGTLVHYDGRRAWVLTCGHLFGNVGESMTPRDRRLAFCVIDLGGRIYVAKVVFYRFTDVDIGLIAFYPRIAVDPVKIADHMLDERWLVSVGCDNASPVASYSVELDSFVDGKYATRENSPRLGRSGGGLFNSRMELVGICVQTSDPSGRGYGYFTGLDAIRKVLKEEGCGYLLTD